LRIVTPEGQPTTIPRDTIEDRATGKSAMPEDIVKKLTKHELRDLVEYLTTLK
jgi:quinoprotein glucose dehydrogenase